MSEKVHARCFVMSWLKPMCDKSLTCTSCELLKCCCVGLKMGWIRPPLLRDPSKKKIGTFSTKSLASLNPKSVNVSSPPLWFWSLPPPRTPALYWTQSSPWLWPLRPTRIHSMPFGWFRENEWEGENRSGERERERDRVFIYFICLFSIFFKF